MKNNKAYFIFGILMVISLFIFVIGTIFLIAEPTLFKLKLSSIGLFLYFVFAFFTLKYKD